MKQIIIGDVYHEITDANHTKLANSGALIGNELDGWFLNPSHSFSHEEVLILVNPQEDAD